MQQIDTFTRWMLGLTSTAIISVGVYMATAMQELKQDVAVLKTKVEISAEYAQRIRAAELSIGDMNVRLTVIERDTSRRR